MNRTFRPHSPGFVWIILCRCEDTLRFQWRRTYVDILGAWEPSTYLKVCPSGVLDREVILLVTVSHFFAMATSAIRSDLYPDTDLAYSPMWTWWLSGAVFKSADVVSTHQTVTETFVSWGLWPGIGITGEVWEAVVVVATSQLWWLWQLISRADGSFWNFAVAPYFGVFSVFFFKGAKSRIDPAWVKSGARVIRRVDCSLSVSLLLDYKVVSSVGSLQCRDICKIKMKM